MTRKKINKWYEVRKKLVEQYMDDKSTKEKKEVLHETIQTITKIIEKNI